MEAFYKMVDGSTVVWVNQSEPRGFGDAVLKAKSFAGTDRFMVHAGDSHFISKNADHLRRVVRMSEESRADAFFLSMEVEDPKRFGIVEGEITANGLVKVTGAWDGLRGDWLTGQPLSGSLLGRGRSHSERFLRALR